MGVIFMLLKDQMILNNNIEFLIKKFKIIFKTYIFVFKIA